MEHTVNNYLITQLQEEFILTWIQNFMIGKKIQGLSDRTIEFYQDTLKTFMKYCERKEINLITQISTNGIRNYLFELEQQAIALGAGMHSFEVYELF